MRSIVLFLVMSAICMNVIAVNPEGEGKSTEPRGRKMSAAEMMERFKRETPPEELQRLQKKAQEILEEEEKRKQERAREVARSVIAH